MAKANKTEKAGKASKAKKADTQITLTLTFEKETKNCFVFAPEEGSPMKGNLYLTRDQFEDEDTPPDAVTVVVTIPA